MIEKHFEDITEHESQELCGTIVGMADCSDVEVEQFIVSSLKESFEKFLRLGYFKALDDCQSAAEHLRTKQEQGA